MRPGGKYVAISPHECVFAGSVCVCESACAMREVRRNHWIEFEILMKKILCTNCCKCVEVTEKLEQHRKGYDQ